MAFEPHTWPFAPTRTADADHPQRMLIGWYAVGTLAQGCQRDCVYMASRRIHGPEPNTWLSAENMGSEPRTWLCADYTMETTRRRKR